MIAASVFATSCAWIAPQESPTSARTLFAPSPLDEVAAHVARLNALSATALAAEARRQRNSRPMDDLARTKAAITLMLAQPADDDADAVALLDPVVSRETADPRLKAMASFLHAMASDRRRLRESAAAANARLRDERRAQEGLRTRAEAAQERAAQLQQKLDALTELEKSLSDRPLSSR